MKHTLKISGVVTLFLPTNTMSWLSQWTCAMQLTYLAYLANGSQFFTADP